ncbi:UDP-N-acetylglucosamine 2-epimerase (non-hydrolyzing) [Vibrio sp. 404]|uniref:UDP-N-acetylglucosamine 2-epimerase (non-hydrolyzing) n=1 Tax=Vibrio marinisediminis TaxID=2758441 RepID=A0A7W2FP32_9VIBR|nr:UDP-N-acetylglucosamine 2-epimerase (non-hydrolyzing) [Vibrio marinisediminis]MBA5761517.1 UDP-N-acetylglucosamine 2-epimerase (non-hydrolyzing) [Vibrio marinisediminis]
MSNRIVCNSLIVTGTRPEIIKMVPVYFALKKTGNHVFWCHTGQHDSLADQTFEAFGVIPDYVFQRPQGEGISPLVSGLLTNIDSLLKTHLFQCVLVHGDTSSTLSAALAAFYNKVPVIAHVEAGLRSGSLSHPFPEESNRLLVAQIADVHFAPTQGACDALLKENISKDKIHVTGNTAIDAQHLLVSSGKIVKRDSTKVLVTAHRRENWQNISIISDAIKKLSALRPELEFVFVVHPNPDVRAKVEACLANTAKVTISEPLDYLALQQCLAESILVLTDSGGIQEEAPSYGKRVVVLRETTERPEAVAQGYSVLAGASDVDRIVESALTMLNAEAFSGSNNPFGDGLASEHIAARINALCGPTDV